MKVIFAVTALLAASQVHAFGGTDENAGPAARGAPVARGAPMTTSMSATSNEAVVMSTSGAEVRGGGGATYCPGYPTFADAGLYCINGNIYQCYQPNGPATFSQNCANGCYSAPPGSPDGCNGSGPVSCPSYPTFGGPGPYCINGDIYQCYQPGDPAQLSRSCSNGCYTAAPGTPDNCNANTPPPTPPPVPQWCQERPYFYGGDACGDFGAYKGKDLAWQACQNGAQAGVRGGGGGSCEYWQEQQCRTEYQNWVRSCCPNTNQNYEYLCNPYSG